MFAPPDDDKARNKHVVLPGGVLSDAGSIPAASTFDKKLQSRTAQASAKCAQASEWQPTFLLGRRSEARPCSKTGPTKPFRGSAWYSAPADDDGTRRCCHIHCT